MNKRTNNYNWEKETDIKNWKEHMIVYYDKDTKKFIYFKSPIITAESLQEILQNKDLKILKFSNAFSIAGLTFCPACVA